ncbi:RNA-guided endonuclease IscB [Aerosakkonema funiforme]|uniref:RRXRR domain-containing protein n=1 Tax=Aerosakkonema funiforme FACHB-1375 TaxID=2949571 RepID=A0A926VKI2_9CYAN|nr:RNA-guided endonuclease IscB [Aerosakkonema funiforme]MBD2185582.1 RRXRR domain-containing protein [Aerosakkonema funiforme FACHB-1375]
MRVFVLDKNRKPLDPCHQARARKLLNKGRAKVFKRYLFSIVLQDRTVECSTVHPHRIKIDPGSKVTGIAVVQEETGRVTNALEITHRGQQIKDALESRRSLRRGRRNRKTRYRKPRFLNRTRKQRWLPPSLENRIANTLIVKAKGHGTRQRCRPDKYGFPKAHAPKRQFFQGFQTGDIVKADILSGKYTGKYTGRIAIRFRPSFVLQLPTQKFDVHPKYLKTIHKADGYEYQQP